MSTTTRRNATTCQVKFYTHEPVLNGYAAWDEFTEPKLIGPVFAWEYDDNLGSTCAGTISISMKGLTAAAFDVLLQGGEPWPDKIQEGDWWVIDVTKNGVKTRLGFGRVDALNVDISADQNGAPIGTVNVSGRTYGWALDDVPVYFNRFDPTLNNALNINMFELVETFAGPGDKVITSMIEGIMDASAGTLFGHIMLPAGLGSSAAVPWYNALSLSKVQSVRGSCPNALAMTPENAPTVWQYVHTWMNPAMNELFLDTNPDPSKAEGILVFREKPFENTIDLQSSPWFLLDTWEVDANTIKSFGLTRGPHRVNHVTLMGDLATGLGADGYGIYQPTSDTDSIKKHGLRRLEESTAYFDADVGGVQNAQSEGEIWHGLVRSWNALNHRYWSGSLTLGEMRPEIRKGSKIGIINGPLGGYKAFPTDIVGVSDSRLTFYVEGVKHSWSEGQAPVAMTVLKVSRGYLESARLTDLAAEVAKYTTLASIPEGSANNPLTLNTLDASTKVQLDASLETEPSETKVLA